MTRLAALAVVALAAGCGGGDGVSREVAERRAADAVARAMEGALPREIAAATVSADETMNRDEGVPLGSGVEEPPDQVTLGAPSLRRSGDDWVASFPVAGRDVVVCVAVSEDEEHVEVRASCR